MQCFKKDDYWGVCKNNCTKKHGEDRWSCETEGSRDWLLSTPPVSKLEGFPSLFCFSFMMEKQADLMKAQIERGAGIFACDEFSVLAFQKVSLGIIPNRGVWGKDKDPIR